MAASTAVQDKKSRLGRFPFDPARLPVFYGWPLLAFGTLGILMSAPGQTVGVSVFTDFLIEAHGLSRSLLSLAYLTGTISSAMVLSRAARLYDRYGGRWVATGSAIVLAVVLVGLSVSPAISAVIAGWLPADQARWVAFAVLATGFLLLRLSGQGLLTLSSRNMVMEWFQRRRGMANAVLGVSLAFGFSAAPRVFESLIQRGGWQWAWRALAVAVLAFAAFAFVTFRARPEDHGLLPDGGSGHKERRTHAETLVGREFALPEARRTYAFWIFALSTVMSGLVMTAVAFHVVSIFSDAGMSRDRAVAVFIPMAFVSVAFEFVGSWISDHVKLKYLAMIQLTGIIVGSVSLAVLADGPSLATMIVGLGMMQGMFGITSSLVWPRFYGRAHLGAISGYAMALVVAGTAVGPYVFSFARDLSGSYAPAALACAGIGAVLLVGSHRAERPT